MGNLSDVVTGVRCHVSLAFPRGLLSLCQSWCFEMFIPKRVILEKHPCIIANTMIICGNMSEHVNIYLHLYFVYEKIYI